MRQFTGFERGMGIGGWLTNYKRFQVLGNDKKKILTVGDFEHFNSYITEFDVKNIAQMGFDHIRLGFDQVVVQDDQGQYREDVFVLIDNFIAWCEKYKVNIVLNLHKAIGNYCDVAEDVSLLDDEKLQDGFVKLWMYIEKRYEDKPRIVFELLNELTGNSAESWNKLAWRTIESIRRLNKTRKIIIGGLGSNSVKRLNDIEVREDENVIYTFHMYEPFAFTHQRGVLQTAMCFYNRDMPYPCEDIERYRHCLRTIYCVSKPYEKYDKMDKQFIYDFLVPAKEFIEKNPNAILWCGEFGTIRHAKIEWRKAWFKDVISFLKENDIPYSVWNYLSTPNDGNRFSLVDDDNREPLNKELLNILLGKF
jgi:hypothetical protein